MYSSDPSTRILKILGAYCDGQITEQELAELEEFVCQSDENQQFYCDYLLLHGELAYDQNSVLLSVEASIKAKPLDVLENDVLGVKEISTQPTLGFLSAKFGQIGQFMSKPISLSISMAFLVIASILISLGLLTITNNSADVVENNSFKNEIVLQQKSVAMITQLRQCQWGNVANIRKVGSVVREGELVDLNKGWVEIVFHNGTKALLEGPLQIKFQSPMSVNLLSGKSTFYVPPIASGFKVDTTAAQIVDLGTVFGVLVSKSERTTVQVKKGSVEVGPMVDGKVKQTHNKKLFAGDMIEIELNQPINEIVQNKNKSLFTWPSLSSSEKHEKWKAYSEKLKKDPSVLAYYTFEKQAAATPHKLINQAVATRGRFDGILGDGKNLKSIPDWSTGRWSSKPALRFDARDLQRVIVNDWQLEESITELTVALWIKQLKDRQRQTLITQWKYSTQKEKQHHLFHLNIRDSFLTLKLSKNRFGFETYKHEKNDQTTTTARHGWRHIVFTIQRNKGAIHLYENGKEVDVTSTTSDLLKFPTIVSPLVIAGQASGGSCFTGLIDEVIIFRRVLSLREIRKIYFNGKPTGS